MKKFLLSAVCIVAIAASGLAGYAHYQQSQIDPAILENLEALSQAEGGDSKKVERIVFSTWPSSQDFIDVDGKVKSLECISTQISCLGEGDRLCENSLTIDCVVRS